jgi:spore coat polysaccharide biosynthesis protein SpsF
MNNEAIAGPKEPKVVAVVTARSSSRRLPGKVLRPLQNRPMIAHTIKRLLSVERVDEVMIATSTDPTDDAIAEFATVLGVVCWRGALEDVLGRIQEASTARSADAVVRISGDSPLIDPAIIRRAIALFLSCDADLITNVFPRSFPRGQSVEVLSRAALERLAAEATEASDREHVTTYAYAHPERFAIRNFVAERPRPELQLSVDTESDMAVVSALIATLGERAEFPTVGELIDLVDAIPHMI